MTARGACGPELIKGAATGTFPSHEVKPGQPASRLTFPLAEQLLRAQLQSERSCRRIRIGAILAPVFLATVVGPRAHRASTKLRGTEVTNDHSADSHLVRSVLRDRQACAGPGRDDQPAVCATRNDGRWKPGPWSHRSARRQRGSEDGDPAARSGGADPDSGTSLGGGPDAQLSNRPEHNDRFRRRQCLRLRCAESRRPAAGGNGPVREFAVQHRASRSGLLRGERLSC